MAEQQKRKSIFESPGNDVNTHNRTSESFKVPFNKNPFAAHQNQQNSPTPNANNQLANAENGNTNNNIHNTKSEHNTTMNSNDKISHPTVILPYLNDDLIKK